MNAFISPGKEWMAREQGRMKMRRFDGSAAISTWAHYARRAQESFQKVELNRNNEAMQDSNFCFVPKDTLQRCILGRHLCHLDTGS